jgi:hypothetical protein
MILYATSQNTGGVDYSSPTGVRLLYLGTDVKKAEDAVGDFQRYAKEKFPVGAMAKSYSALPREMEREIIQFFFADGHWRTIEMFEVT